MNIILCIIDTLRYDYVRAAGVNPWIKTPNIDRLASKSIMFDRVYTGSYPTIPHRTDVMTGEYAWEGQGPFHPWMPLRFDVPTLPRLLAGAGYATQLIHDTPHLVNGGHAFDYPFAAWSFIRGAEVDRPWIDEGAFSLLSNWAVDPLFDYMGYDDPTGVIDRLLLTYARANRHRQKPEDWNTAQLFLKASQFLRENKGRDKFFLWLDCFDPHEPWDSPPEYVRMYDDTPGYTGLIDPRAFYPAARKGSEKDLPAAVIKRQQALYAAKVTWMDHWFGKVLDTLEETGLDENTAVLFTADHGTNLGERGGFGKTWVVNEQEAHVPLFLYLPGCSPARNNSIIQPQDIFTTILNIAGLEPPKDVPGQILTKDLDTGRDFTIAGLGTSSWKGDPHQILFSVLGGERYLNITADPSTCRLFNYGSVENIADQHPDMVKNMRELAWEELACRDTNSDLITWLADGGVSAYNPAWSEWQGAPTWRWYWEGVYED